MSLLLQVAENGRVGLYVVHAVVVIVDKLGPIEIYRMWFGFFNSKVEKMKTGCECML